MVQNRGISLILLDHTGNRQLHPVIGLIAQRQRDLIVLPPGQIQTLQQLLHRLAEGGYLHLLTVVVDENTLAAPDADLRSAVHRLGGVGIIRAQLQAGLSQNIFRICGRCGMDQDPASVGDHIGRLREGRLGQQQQRNRQW